MRWHITILLLSVMASGSAVEMTMEDLRTIIAQPPSAEIIPELNMYPASAMGHFSLKINKSDGTSAFIQCSMQQWYAENSHVVAKLKTMDGVVLHLVRAYDLQQRLYYGWGLHADGTIMHQSGMFDTERKIMSWIGDDVFQGRRQSLRSIQSFADRSLITWKVQCYQDNAFQLEAHGECQFPMSDFNP